MTATETRTDVKTHAVAQDVAQDVADDVPPPEAIQAPPWEEAPDADQEPPVFVEVHAEDLVILCTSEQTWESAEWRAARDRCWVALYGAETLAYG